MDVLQQKSISQGFRITQHDHHYLYKKDFDSCTERKNIIRLQIKCRLIIKLQIKEDINIAQNNTQVNTKRKAFSVVIDEVESSDDGSVARAPIS